MGDQIRYKGSKDPPTTTSPEGSTKTSPCVTNHIQGQVPSRTGNTQAYSTGYRNQVDPQPGHRRGSGNPSGRLERLQTTTTTSTNRSQKTSRTHPGRLWSLKKTPRVAHWLLSTTSTPIFAPVISAAHINNINAPLTKPRLIHSQNHKSINVSKPR